MRLLKLFLNTQEATERVTGASFEVMSNVVYLWHPRWSHVNKGIPGSFRSFVFVETFLIGQRIANGF